MWFCVVADSLYKLVEVEEVGGNASFLVPD